jgi:hypothetical protein
MLPAYATAPVVPTTARAVRAESSVVFTGTSR